MARYTVTVEIEVDADNIDEAWQMVAEPFHTGKVSVSIPEWRNPYIGEPELKLIEEGGE